MTFQSLDGTRLTGILRAEAGCRHGVILAHGLFGHKDYLFFPRLAAALPICSLRFDFRGNGDSTGTPSYAGYDAEVDDLGAAVQFLHIKGIATLALIGHSKGSIVSLLYCCQCRPPVALVVNLCGVMSGRDASFTDREQAALDQAGQFEMKVLVGRQVRRCWVNSRAVDEARRLDLLALVPRLPESCTVVTVHCADDAKAPVRHAHALHRALGPGHPLHVLERGGHFFMPDEVAREMCAIVAAAVTNALGCVVP